MEDERDPVASFEALLVFALKAPFATLVKHVDLGQQSQGGDVEVVKSNIDGKA